MDSVDSVPCARRACAYAPPPSPSWRSPLAPVSFLCIPQRTTRRARHCSFAFFTSSRPSRHCCNTIETSFDSESPQPAKPLVVQLLCSCPINTARLSLIQYHTLASLSLSLHLVVECSQAQWGSVPRPHTSAHACLLPAASAPAKNWAYRTWSALWTADTDSFLSSQSSSSYWSSMSIHPHSQRAERERAEQLGGKRDSAMRSEAKRSDAGQQAIVATTRWTPFVLSVHRLLRPGHRCDDTEKGGLSGAVFDSPEHRVKTEPLAPPNRDERPTVARYWRIQRMGHQVTLALDQIVSVDMRGRGPSSGSKVRIVLEMVKGTLIPASTSFSFAFILSSTFLSVEPCLVTRPQSLKPWHSTHQFQQVQQRSVTVRRRPLDGPTFPYRTWLQPKLGHRASLAAPEHPQEPLQHRPPVHTLSPVIAPATRATPTSLGMAGLEAPLSAPQRTAMPRVIITNTLVHVTVVSRQKASF